MMRTAAILMIVTVIASPAHAGGGIGYSATGPSGTVERVVEQRALPNENIGALVSYTRTDGSRSFVEYAIACEPMAYAYLGITSDDTSRTPNLRIVRTQSDQLLANEISPVSLIPLNDENAEQPIRALSQAVCS